MKSAFRYAEVGNVEVGSGDNAVEVIVFNPIDRDIGNSGESDNGGHESTLDRALSEPSTGKRGNILSSYFNLTNTILGASVLGMPYAFSQTGWLVGTLLIFICGASSAFALHTLSLCAMKLNEQEEDEISRSEELKKFVGATFYAVARASLPKYTLAIDIAIALKCFGVSISYLIVVSDLMPLVAEHCGAKGVWLNRELWVVLGFCSVAPSCFLKDLTSLSIFSSFSLVFVGFFALLVCLYGMGIEGFEPCDGTDQCHGPIVPVVMSTHALKAMPIFVFGFTCQQNMFTVCNEMQNITAGRVNTAINASVGTGLTLYLILAGVGYSTFGSLVENDILVSYPANFFTSVARVFISLLVLLSYPMQCHPARRCVLTIIQHCRSSSDSTGSSIGSGGSGSAAGGVGGMCRFVYNSLLGALGMSAHRPIPLAQESPRGTTNPVSMFTFEEEDEDGTIDLEDSAKAIDSSVTSGVYHMVVDDGSICADVDRGVVDDGGVDAAPSGGVSQDTLFLIVTIMFLALSFIIALTVSDLSVVLAFVGATGSTAVSYILPGFFYYYMFKSPEDGPVWKRNLAWVQGMAGIVIVPLCLTFIFLI